MTSKRDLGVPLAFAGLGLVVVAVIAGFIAVGGPGDARDRRLDDLMLNRISNIANAAQCAYLLDGAAPADLAALNASVERSTQRAVLDARVCDIYGNTPLANDVEYSKLADNRIRACGNFRRLLDPEDKRPRMYRGDRPERFPELSRARPAGRHCYDILLVKPAPVPLR